MVIKEAVMSLTDKVMIGVMKHERTPTILSRVLQQGRKQQVKGVRRV
jgi:hypothetical protein